MARVSQTGWRRVFSFVLAYALVLQGFVFALGDGRPAGAATNVAWAGFELCKHSGGGSTSPVVPSPIPVGDNHCPFCFAGAAYVACAPPFAPEYSKVVLTNAMWPLAPQRLAAFLVNESAWPRGPPSAT